MQSALVRMIAHARLPCPATDERVLGRVVATAFSQRRKTLRNALSPFFTAGELERLGIDPRRRPQDLGVAEYVRLANEAARRAR